MKSNKKRIILVLAILTMALVLSCALVACDKKGTGDKTNSNDLGVYYEVVGSSLDEKSYIELKSGNVWYDGEDQGTFKINGGNITLYDGDMELMSGTISNGVLTLSFMGETTVYRKTGSMGSGNVDQKAMIKSIQNGKVDGLTVSLEIDNTIEDVDLSGMITTSKDCSWQLYTSKTATAADAIVTKIVVPKNGNSTYYIVVTSADGKINRTYTLNVWKNYYVTLSFYANGTFYTSEQVLTHTTYGSGPSCSVVGYTFNGWGCDGYYVTESKSFNANLTPLTYSAKFDSNGGSTVINKTATFNKDLSLPSPYRTGYTFLGWYLNGNLYKDSIKYTYTNDVTFTARWQINSYNVIIKSDNEELGTVHTYNGKKDYNSTVSLSATTKLGCSFVGWFANGTKISTNKTCTINVPAYNVIYVAKFEIDKNLANLKCSITEDSCVITGVLDKNITTVLIPDYVTGISDSAFSGCTSLTSITGSATNVSTVAKQANPTSFTVNITSGTSIGNYAFRGCTGLMSVTIPESVTSVGSYAFTDCTGLTNISGSTTNVITIAKQAKPSSFSVNITSGTSIGYSAFDGCSGLTNVTIGNSVTSIGAWAFSSCTGLTSVTIGNGVTSIGDRAFDNCTGLTSITMPDGVTSIGYAAFNSCVGLTSISGSATNVSTVAKQANPTSFTVNITSGTSIGNYAFRGCTGLTSITIPDSVTNIGSSAFSGCTGLTSIKIPDSVTNIGSSAFSGCTGLTNVTIGNSVTSIGDYAFSHCSGLTSIFVEKGNAKYHSDGNCLIDTENKTLISGCKNSIIPADGSVTIIGAGAFSGCTGLTSITIPDSVTSIGEQAFYNCSGLTSVTIPDSVTSIGGSVFSNCTDLSSIFVADDNAIYHSAGNCLIKTQSKTLIAGCKNSIIPSDGSVTNIGKGAFSGCTGLTSVTIPNGVTSIGYSAFYGCTGLTSITIPNGVTGIDYAAFAGCTGLTSIKIPDSVMIIGSYAFSGCTGLTSVTIGGSVTSIGDYAFSGCTGLTSITIPDSVTSIGASAFRGCTGLTSVTIGNGVTSLGSYAFENCTGLISINVAKGNTKYHSDGNCLIETESKTLIFGCKTSVIPSDGSVTSIGKSAFSGCTGLTSITIPDSVTSIGDSAFFGCSGLSSVTIGNNVTSIGDSAFSGCTGLTSITIGNSVTSIGDFVFRDCSGLTSITIPDSVTSIGYSAFYGCTGLTSIKFNGTIAQWKAISKGTSWKYSVPATEVVCKDGTVSI